MHSPNPRLPSAASPAAGIISIACIALGGLAANQWIPMEEYYLPGALKTAASLLAFALLIGPFFSIGGSPINALKVENLLSVGLVYWLLFDFIVGEPEMLDLRRDAIVQSFIAIEVFAMALWLGSIINARSGRGLHIGTINSQLREEIGTDFLAYAAISSGVLGLARYFVGCKFSLACLADSFYMTRFQVPWNGKGTFPEHTAEFFYLLRYFGFVVLPLTIALVSLEKRFTMRALVGLLLSAACLLFISRDGGRREVGTVVGSTLITWFLLRDRLQIKHMLAAAMVLPLLIFLMHAMLIARDVGFGRILDGSVSLFGSEESVGVVDKNLMMMAHVIDLVPDRVPFAGWPGAMNDLFLWVPFIELPPKGLDIGYELGWYTEWWWSWTCSAVGDLYLIGGFPLIVLGGMIFGVLAEMTNRFLGEPATVRKRILFSLAAMTLFVSLRAIHEYGVTGLTLVVYAGLLYVGKHWQTLRQLPPASYR